MSTCNAGLLDARPTGCFYSGAAKLKQPGLTSFFGEKNVEGSSDLLQSHVAVRLGQDSLLRGHRSVKERNPIRVRFSAGLKGNGQLGGHRSASL